MKKILAISLVFVSSISFVQTESEADSNEIIYKNFSKGKSESPSDFFAGIVNLVVLVDVQFRRLEYLDQKGEADIKLFKKTIIKLRKKIKYGRKCLAKNSTSEYKLAKEFITYSYDWLTQIEGLVDNYLSKLIECFIIPDDKWTDENLEFYSEYTEAYKIYYAVDSIWVDYQYVFADSNNFEIGETIDEEKMIQTED